MNPQYQALPAEAGYVKENTGQLRLTDSQQSSLWWNKCVWVVLTFISAGVSLGLVLSDPDTWTREFPTTVSFRDGSPLAADGYPTLVTTVVGPTNIGLAASFISILAFVAYVFVLIVHSSEIEQMNRGSDPFYWIYSLLWVPVYVLVAAYMAGVVDVFIVSLLLGLAVAGIVIYWANDLLHQHAFRESMARASDGTTWSWVPFFWATLFWLIVAVVIFIQAGFTFDAPTPPAGGFLAIPITLPILLIITVVLLILYLNSWIFSSMYGIIMALYIWGGISVLVGTWLTLGMFAGNSP